MSDNMVYYNLSRNWKKRIVPHLGDPELNHILVTDMNKYTFGRWGKPFTLGRFPDEFESNDWRCDRRGKWPPYWRYVKHAACHWIVNFSLRLAMLALPDRQWRIISSQAHSTVWDGERTLFDFNFQALGIPPDECFRAANKRRLPVGKFLRVHFAEPIPQRHSAVTSVAAPAPPD